MAQSHKKIDTLPSDANAIFKDYSVAEIESVSQEIEQRSSKIHSDLQALVSLKYRDLLKTSDLIIEMNEVSQKQDKELYELSFVRNAKLDKLFKIETNIDRFESIKTKNVEFDLGKNERRVRENNENFLKLSNFLNIDESEMDNLEIIEIIKQNLRVPIALDSWFFKQRELILDKFERLKDVTIRNISSNFKLWEVLKTYRFWKGLKLFENDSESVDISKIEEEIFRNLIMLIDNDYKHEDRYTSENLVLIIKEFDNFRDRILRSYTGRIREIELGIKEIEDDEKLNLYELDSEDPDYLNNVKNLKNGLYYKRYQELNSNILEFEIVLNVLRELDTNQYESNKAVVLKSIQDFKELSIKENNKLLTKYLDKLSSQISTTKK